jgi:hypothetical protein
MDWVGKCILDRYWQYWVKRKRKREAVRWTVEAHE